MELALHSSATGPGRHQLLKEAAAPMRGLVRSVHSAQYCQQGCTSGAHQIPVEAEARGKLMHGRVKRVDRDGGGGHTRHGCHDTEHEAWSLPGI
eukprot:4385208-Alexandrium_andersonii.AAC.2